MAIALGVPVGNGTPTRNDTPTDNTPAPRYSTPTETRATRHERVQRWTEGHPETVTLLELQSEGYRIVRVIS